MISPDPQPVHVALGDDAYDIRIATGWLDQLGDLVRRLDPRLSHVALIADSAIDDSWATRIAATMERAQVRVSRTTIPSGEASKSSEQIVRLWQWLLSEGADRKTLVLAVGGGVVGDLAGFAAASFARGLPLVQVPTTLLSQVDSSVGGKTGINLPDAKNMVGAFWQPRLVAIDTATLDTLPDREFISGFAEVIKYGVILDADFFGWLQQNSQSLLERDAKALQHAVRRSCQLKAQVVVEDEHETSGRRAILNYGHTFAHAIEATAGYGEFLHGEAVAIGMQMAAVLAHRLGRIDQALLDAQLRLIQDFRLPARFADADVDAMLQAMARDKKVAHGKLRFVLPTRLGHVELVDDVPTAETIAAINACR